jgi:hypothetical protein
MVQRLLSLSLFLSQMALPAIAQQNDSLMLRRIFTSALENGKAYEWLDFMCNRIGHRFTGTDNADKAVGYTKAVMEAEKLASVRLQQVEIPRWRRNNVETLELVQGGKKTPLSIFSLGGSIGTPPQGVRARVIEITTFEQLDSLGAKAVSGKIVFYNVPFNQKNIRTFHSYGEIGKYRYWGAVNAAKYGAVASITRSLSSALDDNPHTGAMAYNDTIRKIPACAVSTVGAEKLAEALRQKPNLEVELKMNCENLSDSVSYNVIGEVTGTEHPEEIIVVSGHLDSWDKGHGAHDDGAGCVQAMEVLRIFRELGYKPKRTVRVVLFMNEENGLRGAKQYAASAKVKGEKHIAAIESDAGGFTPHGFSSKCTDKSKEFYLKQWRPLLEPYGLYDYDIGGGGADINQLEDQGTLLIGLMPDSQRYFDYHHTAIDTFEKVNKRELHLGAAAMAGLVYLLSEYGVK